MAPAERRSDALHIPESVRAPDIDTLALALALAGAGFYVIPTAAREPRHAGLVLGKGWPNRSSRDADQLAAWFAGTDHRVAIHCGRSGVVALDVDHFDQVSEPVYKAISGESPPFQNTRAADTLDGEADLMRGHYLFLVPPGRRLTNSNGGLGRGWGEVRGNNGIILVGGVGREWVQTGVVPVLPEYVAALLPDGGDRASSVSDKEVAAFVRGHRAETRPARMGEILTGFQRVISDGGSRHQALVGAACWATREAARGHLDARLAFRRLSDEFVAAMREARRAGDRTLARTAAESEALSAIGWAVAQEGATETAPGPAERLSPLGGDGAVHGAEHDPHEPAPDPHALVGAPARLPVVDLVDDPDALAAAVRGAADQTEREALARQIRLRREAQAIDDALRRRPLRRMSAAQFLAAPMPIYRVPGLLYEDALAVVFGPPGAAKTFFMLDLCLSLATGRPWRGDVVVPRTRVHYLMAEGQAVNVGRTWAWLTHHGVDPGELDGWFDAFPEPLDLTPEGVARYLAEVQADRPGVIVLDTKHAMLTGDESKAADVKVMRDALDAMRRVCGSSVVLVDHTGLSNEDRARGSNSQKAMIATEVRLSVHGTVRTAEITRNTAGAAKGSWSFELHEVRDAPRPADLDVPVVPVPVDDPVDSPFRAQETWNRDDQLPLPLDVAHYTGRGQGALRELSRFMRHSATTGIGHTMVEARRALWGVFTDPSGKPLHSEDTITRAWGALVEMGRLMVSEGGQSTSRSKWLPRPGDPGFTVDLDS